MEEHPRVPAEFGSLLGVANNQAAHAPEVDILANAQRSNGSGTGLQVSMLSKKSTVHDWTRIALAVGIKLRSVNKSHKESLVLPNSLFTESLLNCWMRIKSALLPRQCPQSCLQAPFFSITHRLQHAYSPTAIGICSFKTTIIRFAMLSALHHPASGSRNFLVL